MKVSGFWILFLPTFQSETIFSHITVPEKRAVKLSETSRYKNILTLEKSRVEHDLLYSFYI